MHFDLRVSLCLSKFCFQQRALLVFDRQTERHIDRKAGRKILLLELIAHGTLLRQYKHLR